MKRTKNFGLLTVGAICIAVIELGIYLSVNKISIDPFLQINLAILSVLAVLGLAIVLACLLVSWLER